MEYFPCVLTDKSLEYKTKMLSEVAGNKMISYVASITGGATPLSEAGSGPGFIEASSVPAKSMAKGQSSAEMPPPRIPGVKVAQSPEKLKVAEFNEFFICFLCRGYKIEATTINECMHSCK